MKLITKAIENALTKQGDTSEIHPDKIKVVAKFFGGSATWYLYDWDRETCGPDFEGFDGYPKRTDGLPDRLWVFANLGDSYLAECGTVLLSELESIKFRPFNLRVERDLHFSPMSLSEVMGIIKNGGHV